MATKKAAAKAQEPATAAVGSFIKFTGYGEDVPEDQQILTEGNVYEVVELTEGGVVVRADNPAFDADSEETDANAKIIETEVLVEEFELTDAPVKAAPAVTRVKAGKVAGKEKAEAKTAAKAPAKEKAAEKAPAAAKEKAPAKGRDKPAPAAKTTAVAKPEAANEDDVVTLTEEQEDPAILAIVNESDDLVATLQDLEADIGQTEYKIGGVLYHVKKSGSYKELNPAYKEALGFANFLRDHMNIDYRKAMNLIDIYVTFSKAGLENPGEIVARIGWTKASKLTASMRANPDATDDLIKLAEENTVADLVTSIKEQNVEVGGTKGEVVKRISMKFRFFEEQGRTLVDIIQAAKAQQGLASDDDAVAFILTDWAASNIGKATEAEAPKQASPAKAAAKPAAKAAPKARAAA